jgi:outer membrane receptor for ferrienterochelin and colicins
VIGNPDLAPEKSWGLNGDVTWRPEPSITLRASAFANWTEELIELALAPAGSRASVDDYTYQNITAARTFGGQINAAYKAASWLSTEVGYAYLWTRDDTNERPLAGRPPHTVSASVRVKLPLRLELTARFRTVMDAFIDDNLRAPAFSTLDGRLSRPLWPGSLAYIGALNALDIRKDPDLPGDQRPIAGRTLYVGLTIEPPSETDP